MVYGPLEGLVLVKVTDTEGCTTVKDKLEVCVTVPSVPSWAVTLIGRLDPADTGVQAYS